jgi:dCMP deaminase
MYNVKWDKRYLRLAKTVAEWSKDPRKRCGAIIVENEKIKGIGYNGFPRGVKDTRARLSDKALKLKIIVHAEVNAIVASDGKGDSIYVWPQLPCGQCIGLIIQAGIKRVITRPLSPDTRWDQDLVVEVAKEAGIEIITYNVR